MDERLAIKTIFNSWTGMSITVVLSLASAVTSALVIYLILRSEKKLSQSVFHRIFFGISVADIIHYLSMATSTLPMPTDMIYTDYQGLILGNDLTCAIQGNLVAFGAFAGFAYNAMLAVYYLCSINYDIHDEVFRRRFEPILHCICICISISSTITGNFGNGYHPSPTSLSWCGFTKYPYWCEGDTCINFGRTMSSNFVATINKLTIRIGSLNLCLSSIVIISSMIAIAWKVRKEEKYITRNMDNASRRHSILIQTHILTEKKVVFGQAIAYSIVNVLGFSMVALPQLIRILNGKNILPVWWQVSYLILRPLQGSLNSAIFIYHKAHGLQRVDDGLEFCVAFRMALTGKEGRERLIADTTLLRRQEMLDRLPVIGDASPSSASVSGASHLPEPAVPTNFDRFEVSIGATTPAEKELELHLQASSEDEEALIPQVLLPRAALTESSQDLSGFSTTEANESAPLERSSGGK